MTNLNYPIEGKTAQEIAAYFGFSVELVEDAIRQGCVTYQSIYDFCKSDIQKALDAKDARIAKLRAALFRAQVSFVAMSESTEENGLPSTPQELINMCDDRSQKCKGGRI